MTAKETHLGELAAALVDGALDGESRDLALVHIAGCAPCRDDVEAQRRLKERLRRLSEPELPTDLAERLSAVSHTRGAGLRPGGAPRPPTAAVTRRRRARRVAGAVSFVAVGLIAAVALGTARHQEPAVSPQVGRFTVEHARTTGGFPGADPASGAVITVSVQR